MLCNGEIFCTGVYQKTLVRLDVFLGVVKAFLQLRCHAPFNFNCPNSLVRKGQHHIAFRSYSGSVKTGVTVVWGNTQAIFNQTTERLNFFYLPIIKSSAVASVMCEAFTALIMPPTWSIKAPYQRTPSSPDLSLIDNSAVTMS